MALLVISLFFEGPSFGHVSAQWSKYSSNPVIGGSLGTVFDVCLLKEGHTFRMWASWRPKKSIALFESADGIRWSESKITLSPEPDTGWEDDVNRPVVVKKAGLYHMWYTGQSHGRSSIGFVTSTDGLTWKRVTAHPVLLPDQTWEKVAVMCPDVIWDAHDGTFKMWYSGGEQYEPDAIGYATSTDGIHWRKAVGNPVFQADPKLLWEHYKVTACQVVLKVTACQVVLKVTACQVVLFDGWYYMFYIGFRDIDHAQIGLARSRDGITQWHRLPANPIIGPTLAQWDAEACYKPFALLDGNRWMLWYNGRRANREQIGLAIHSGKALW